MSAGFESTEESVTISYAPRRSSSIRVFNLCIFYYRKPSKHWIRRFIKRNPDLQEKIPEKAIYDRNFLDEEKTREWFFKDEDFFKDDSNPDDLDLLNEDDTISISNLEKPAPRNKKHIQSEKGVKGVYKSFSDPKIQVRAFDIISID